jgi:hypothetical protein
MPDHKQRDFAPERIHEASRTPENAGRTTPIRRVDHRIVVWDHTVRPAMVTDKQFVRLARDQQDASRIDDLEEFADEGTSLICRGRQRYIQRFRLSRSPKHYVARGHLPDCVNRSRDENLREQIAHRGCERVISVGTEAGVIVFPVLEKRFGRREVRTVRLASRVLRHDAVSRSVQFNDKLIAFAKHWGFRPRACAPYRARTKGKTENGVGYVKKNAIAGHSFASWEAFEAHLAKWEREVANVRIHGTTGEAPIARFERDEAHRLKPLGGRPSFGSLRELTRVVGNDCAVEIDTNSYSGPWRLIGERVAVTVAAGEVRIRHGVREVAVHKQSEGRRLRIVDSAHLDGVAGRDGAVCRAEIAAPTVPASSPPPSLLRSLAEYETAIGGSF